MDFEGAVMDSLSRRGAQEKGMVIRVLLTEVDMEKCSDVNLPISRRRRSVDYIRRH